VIVTLPFTPSIPNQEFTTQIGGVVYVFSARWNAREGAWRMSIATTDGTAIIDGVKIVLGAYLGRTCTHPLFHAGVFVAVDTTAQGIEATLDDFGLRVVVNYLTVPDILRRLSAVVDNI
jgi:hypothetical protein